MIEIYKVSPSPSSSTLIAGPMRSVAVSNMAGSSDVGEDSSRGTKVDGEEPNMDNNEDGVAGGEPPWTDTESGTLFCEEKQNLENRSSRTHLRRRTAPWA